MHANFIGSFTTINGSYVSVDAVMEGVRISFVALSIRAWFCESGSAVANEIKAVDGDLMRGDAWLAVVNVVVEFMSHVVSTAGIDLEIHDVIDDVTIPVVISKLNSVE